MPLELVPDNDAERLWTVPELAKSLRMSQTKIRGLIDDGRFGPYQDVAETGQRAQRRVPDSGRLAYLESITIRPRRTA